MPKTSKGNKNHQYIKTPELLKNLVVFNIGVFILPKDFPQFKNKKRSHIYILYLIYGQFSEYRCWPKFPAFYILHRKNLHKKLAKKSLHMVNSARKKFSFDR